MASSLTADRPRGRRDMASRAWDGESTPGVLLSYWATRNRDVAQVVEPWQAMGCKVFADSGAFTAMSKRQTIDVADYARWLERWHDCFDVYANLDMIGNDTGTKANQAYLEERGLAPLPVFHVGEPWDELDAMAERYDRLAFGGMVSFRRGRAVGPWIAKAYRTVAGRARVHGFGVTNWEFVWDFPWVSIDSTTWQSGHRFGAQMFWTGTALLQQTADRITAHDKALRALGFSADLALAACRGDHRIADMIGLRSMARAQEAIRRHDPEFVLYCSGVV